MAGDPRWGAVSKNPEFSGHLTHRLQFENHAQNLKKIKAEVHGKLGKKGTSEISSGAEGMHEAIKDIVKSMRDLTKFIS